MSLQVVRKRNDLYKTDGTVICVMRVCYTVMDMADKSKNLTLLNSYFLNYGLSDSRLTVSN